MGHDNIDKNIKKKLEQRTIQPSSEAWGKLSNMLDEEKEQSNKKGFYSYAVAASVLLLLGFFIASQFNDDNSIIIKEELVEVENTDAKTIVNDELERAVVSPFEKEEIAVVHKKDKEEVVEKNETTYAYAESLDRNQFVNQEKEVNAIKEKVNQYLDQLKKTKQEKSNHENSEYSIDAEINALLAEASSNLPDETVKNDVPAFQLDRETDMLLADAFQELNFNPEEDTINETLKNKLFKQLEKGYSKSRMLLAERSQLTRPKEYTSIY